ncbi:hypothetical protein KA005_20120 [bacterium]|nr:hypothetical protein [bacterium]
MKNQYFGDTRDLFKYDLIEHICNAQNFSEFSFIPMLTPDDETSHGENRDYSPPKPGHKNNPLIDFLKKYSAQPPRDFTQIRNYYKQIGINSKIYSGKKYYDHKERISYFSGIKKDYLSSSLVFIDPDIGFQPQTVFNDAHLGIFEFYYLLEKAQHDTIFMVIQFPIQRQNRKIFIKNKIVGLTGLINTKFISIDTNELFFLFTSRSSASLNRLQKTLKKYQAIYHKTITRSKFI